MTEPISTIVNVQISRQTQNVTQAGFGVPLILTNEDSGWGGELVREYLDLDAVLEDFGSGTDTYKCASSIFAQNPKVEKVKIGTEGTRTAQIVTVVFNADIITGNSIALTVDGTALTQAFNTDHLTTMQALATQIQALASIATATVGGSGNRTITITAQKAGVPIEVGTAVVTGGASQATAVTTTTTQNVGVADFLSAIKVEDDDWYGLLWIERDADLVLTCAEYIETQRKIFATCSSDTDILDDTVATDIASRLSLANYERTFIIFNADPLDFADGAWIGNCFTFEPGEETWKFKTLNGIIADNGLTDSEKNSARDKNCNLYLTTGGNDITSEGVMSSGEFIDVIRGVDWLQARLEERVFARLISLPKVPFTDAGIAIIENEVRGVLENAEGIGLLANDPKFTVTVPKAVDVPVNDRANRLLPDVRFTGRLAGAIHKINIRGVVTV